MSKLSGFINDSLIHQLPILANFKEWLLKLNMANASSSGSGAKDLVMIEAVPGIYQSLEETYKGKYRVVQKAKICQIFRFRTFLER